jgi:probable blue pigment (indigoidine) exporter
MNLVLAMVTAFFWGTTYAVTQYSLPGWPPLLLGALRALPAGLLLLALRPGLPSRQDWGGLLRLGAINIALFFSLIFVMALTLPSAISGVGMLSVPVFAMLYHGLLYRTRPSLVQLFSGIGLVLLAWQLFNPETISLNPLGLMAMLGAILCIVMGSNITKSAGQRVHWWSVLCWQLIIGGALLALLALVQAVISSEPYVAAWAGLSTRNALGVLWLVLLNTVLSYGLYVWLLRRMTVVEFSFGGIANPMAGIVLGILFLGESYSPYQYALMAGMMLAALLPSLWPSLPPLLPSFLQSSQPRLQHGDATGPRLGKRKI